MSPCGIAVGIQKVVNASVWIFFSFFLRWIFFAVPFHLFLRRSFKLRAASLRIYVLWSVVFGGVSHSQCKHEWGRAGMGLAETEEKEEEVVVMVEGADEQKFSHSRQTGHLRWSA